MALQYRYIKHNIRNGVHEYTFLQIILLKNGNRRGHRTKGLLKNALR